MALNLYRVILKNPETEEIYELSPKSFSFSEELNKESTAFFTFGFEEFKKIAASYDMLVLAVFTGSLREIWIERRTTVGTYQKIFWGVVTNFELAPEQGGQRSFTVNAVSWFGIFSMRITGTPVRTFSSTDAGEIAWTLIDESQTSDPPYSDLGITEGSIDASKSRDRTYRFDNVRDAIVALSNSNLKDGFDLDIDNTKAFNVYYPFKGNDVFSVVFDERNLASYHFKKPLILSLVNKVHVIGAGYNDDIVYETRTGTTGNRGDWTTQEKKLSEFSTEDTTLLEDKGDKYLNLYQAPIVEFVAEHYDNEISIFDYSLGDSIKVNLPDLDLPNTTKRVVRRNFSLSADKGIGYIKAELIDPNI